jgi:hypothetical protein
MIKRRSAFIALGRPPPVDAYILEQTIRLEKDEVVFHTGNCPRGLRVEWIFFAGWIRG